MSYLNLDTNTILNSLNDNIFHFMKPILEHYDEQLSIANEINALLERLPKYKQLVEKYNDLIEKYEILEKENNKLNGMRVYNNNNNNNNNGWHWIFMLILATSSYIMHKKK